MPAAEGRNTLSNKALGELRQIRKAVLGANGDQGQYGGGGHAVSGRRYWGKVVTPITSGAMGCPTTFTFDVWLPDPNSTADPIPFVVATDSTLRGVPGVNRDADLTAAAGRLIKVEYNNAEWSVYWLGRDRSCSSSSSSTSTNSKGSSSVASVSGASSSSGSCGCVTVVTGVTCSGGSLSVTYGSARGCC